MRMPNISSIKRAIADIKYVPVTYTGDEIKFLNTLKETWGRRLRNIDSASLQKLQRQFFTSESFKQLAEFSAGELLLKILMDVTPDSADYKQLVSNGVHDIVTFAGFIKFGLNDMYHLDTLRIGTIGHSHKHSYTEGTASVMRVRELKSRQVSYAKYTLPALTILAERLECDQDFIEDDSYPDLPLTTQFDCLYQAMHRNQAVVDEDVNNDLFDWLRDFFSNQAGEFNVDNKIYNFTDFANLDSLVDYFISANILADETFAHQVFDRAHFKALITSADHTIQFQGDTSRRYLLSDLMRAICVRLDSEGAQYSHSTSQLKLCLMDLASDLHKCGKGYSDQDVEQYRSLSRAELWRAYREHHGGRFSAAAGIFGRFSYKPYHKIVARLRARATDHEGASRATVDQFSLGR